MSKKIIEIDRGNGTETEISLKRLKRIVKKYYKGSPQLVDFLLIGKVEEIRTPFFNYKIKR